MALPGISAPLEIRNGRGIARCIGTVHRNRPSQLSRISGGEGGPPRLVMISDKVPDPNASLEASEKAELCFLPDSPQGCLRSMDADQQAACDRAIQPQHRLAVEGAIRQPLTGLGGRWL